MRAVARHSPDFIVDGVQLFLQHEGQRLGVRVVRGGKHVHVGEDGLGILRLPVRQLPALPAELGLDVGPWDLPPSVGLLVVGKGSG